MNTFNWSWFRMVFNEIQLLSLSSINIQLVFEEKLEHSRIWLTIEEFSVFLKTPLQPLFPRLPFLRKAAAVFQNAGKVLFEWKPKRLAVQRSFLQRIDHRVTPVWLLPPIWQRLEITNFTPIYCIQYQWYYHFILRFINVICHGEDIYPDTIFLLAQKYTVIKWLILVRKIRTCMGQYF